MTGVKVAIPLYRGRRRFHLEKGRRWSAVEHLVLAGLADGPKTAAELAAAGDMPHRLAVEMLIRLMRAGWVELRPTSTGTLFNASESGVAAAAMDELPILTKPASRVMNFLIDRITGTIFKTREMPFLHENAIRERLTDEPLVWIEARDSISSFDVRELVAHLFKDDEHFVAIDPAGDRLMPRYGLVTVRGEQIDGLSTRAPDELRQAVVEAGKLGSTTPHCDRGAVFVVKESIEEEKRSPEREIHFDARDVIVGGPEHRDAFQAAIAHAKSRVLIHSTFISEAAFDIALPGLVDAAKRGAVVDVLWGEGDDPRSQGRTRLAVGRISAKLARDGLASLVRLHPFTTRSHAKFIVTDKGRTDRHVALLGSCNWLSGNMSLTEVSVRLSDPGIVSDLLFQAVELTRGANGYLNGLTSEFAKFASDVGRHARTPKGTGSASKTPSAATSARLVIGPEHKGHVRQARDTATTRIFVASHRISAAARQAVVLPAIAAARDRGIATEILYGADPDAKAGETARLLRDLDTQGLTLNPVGPPVLHAKVLAWDDDDLVVSSQNWLSADPSEANPRREIGVHLHCPGIASSVIARIRGYEDLTSKGNGSTNEEKSQADNNETHAATLAGG